MSTDTDTKPEENVCEFCGKPLPKKPVKTHIFYSLHSDRYTISERKTSRTTTQLFCSLKCRDENFGNWIDCNNPPKDAINIEDNYPNEPNGQFYCPTCKKQTSKKTISTTCISCGTSLHRLQVLHQTNEEEK